MDLLPPDVRAALPPLYSQEQNPDPTVHVKFFTPWAGWTWYATEGEPEEDDFRFFGYVVGLDAELGYFMLSELAEARGPGGLMIERDLYFKPCPLSQVQQEARP